MRPLSLLMTKEAVRAAFVIEKNLITRRKHMKPKHVRKLLNSEINRVASNPKDYCVNSDSNFTRKRKLPMKKMLSGIIGMQSGSLTNELIDLFDASPEAPTASAFSQQRNKVKPDAFKSIFDGFSDNIMNELSIEMPILAIDGSDIQIATDPNDSDSYFPGTNGQKDYNLFHLNALYKIKHQVYVNSIIQKAKDKNEHKALQEMVDNSSISKALVIADRGYESYNNLAHIQEKEWFYLIRIKDGKSGIKHGLILPDESEFDVHFTLKLTRKQTKETKELFKDRNHYKFVPANTTFDYLTVKNKKSDPTKFYELKFRIVRFPLSEDKFETIITNLDADAYPMLKIKELYDSRWGIETSFRDLKYTIGMLNFHSKKVMCIQQEIYARMIMYNFVQMITSHVVIVKKQRKHTYKANFSVATHMCRLFYREKTTSPNLETIIAKNLIPIRPDRHRERNLKVKTFHGFLYRVA